MNNHCSLVHCSFVHSFISRILNVMKIAIVTDWLTVFGGAEHAIVEMHHEWPHAPLFTSVANTSRLGPLSHADIRTTRLQKLYTLVRHHQVLLPFLPRAIEELDLREFDVIVSSSHAVGKGLIPPSRAVHLCYCHTPMRYAWDFRAEAHRFPRPARGPARGLMAAFRRWDRASAGRVTRFVANSSAVAGRIRRFYRRAAQVVPPPVRTDFFTPGGERDDGFLYVGRLVAYKRPDLVVEAFRDLPYRLTVVGDGHMAPRLRARATPNVTFLEGVDDEGLRALYRRARALVYPADEDFGIVMAEAQACGTPVVALDRGGARDIVTPGVGGWLMGDQDVATLRRAVRRAAAGDLDEGAIRAGAERFSAAAYRTRMRELVAEMIHDPTPA